MKSMTLNQLLVINISLYMVSDMNALICVYIPNIFPDI